MAFELFRQRLFCNGVGLFRGTLPPRLSELELPDGVSARPHGPYDKAHWVAVLTHAKWGQALVMAPRDIKPPSSTMVDSDHKLNDSDKALAHQAGSVLTVGTDARKSFILSDRKAMLFFLNAVLGDDGLMGYDSAAYRFWTRAALNEELSHDAPLDVDSIFAVHHVVAPDYPGWLHTHGLADVGAKDFDILNPHEDVTSISGRDLLRAIAFAVLEGTASAGQKFALAKPGGLVEFVDVAHFTRRAISQWAQLRTMDDDSHEHDRLILCEPRRGLLGRWFPRYEPSRFLRQEIDDGIVFPFSTAATEMMAERARGTLPILRNLCEEFAGLDLTILAKIGYPTDSGGADGREHLWFTVHGCDDGSIDGTLENDPFDIATMTKGMRAQHSVENLTDWLLISPLGTVTPRDMRNLPCIREHREELRPSA